MKSLLRPLLGALLLWCSVQDVMGEKPGITEAGKLHPYFRQIIRDASAKTGLQARVAAVYDAIIYTTTPDAVRAAGIRINSVLPQFVTARVTANDLERMMDISAVTFIDPGSENFLHNDVSVPETGASLLHGGFVNGTQYTGQGAIVLVYDTGIDWKHMDFRDPANPAKSRILAIWDQTLTPIAGESSPAGMGYGVEYTRAQIEDELDGTPTGFVREIDHNGHGSHVAGTSAGNGASLGGKYAGMAPGADIIAVKGGESSFSETRMIDGITYAAQKNMTFARPIAVNFSIGGQSGPHDGTRAYETAIDNFVSTPGRAVVVSAGNDGDVPMHINGTMAAFETAIVTINVPAYTATSGTENDKFYLDVWFHGNPDVTAKLNSPTPISFTRTAGQTGDGPDVTDGTMTLWNTTSSLNSARNVEAFVHDMGVNTPKQGAWTLELKNNSSSTLSYDGWLIDKTVGGATVTVAGGNTAETVAMPATSAGAITVAAYATKWSWPTYSGVQRTYSSADRTDNICTFSSRGPTRDGRIKPDISAPGQGISSVLSSGMDTTGESGLINPGQKHWLLQGTSMAAPHVTGACALLFGAKSTLTSVQVKALLASAGNSDAFATGLPNTTWGAGKLDIVEALARGLSPAATIVRKTFAYDAAGSSATRTLAGTGKMGVRITPDVSGRLTGIQLNVTSNSNGIVGAGNMQCEIFSNSAGFPGAKMGNTVLKPLPALSRGMFNYIQMLDANVSVNSGTDYFLVVSVPGAGDTIRVRQDIGATLAERSASFDGASWSPITTANLRIRGIVTTSSGASSVDPPAGVVGQFELQQNYPNPFNPATTIGFTLPAPSFVTLKIFNMIGQEVSTLANEAIAAGTHEVRWRPDGLASGVYVYRLQARPADGRQAGAFVESRKLMYLK